MGWQRASLARLIGVGSWCSPVSHCLSIYRFGNGLLGFRSAACSCLPENEAGVPSAHVMESIKLLSKATRFLTP